MIHSNLALIEESLVVLGLTRGTRVGYAQSDDLTDVPVLVSLQLRPGTENKMNDTHAHTHKKRK